MNLKAKYQLTVKRYLEGAEDAHGNPVPSWGPDEYVSVYGIAPGSSNEPAYSGRDAVITGLTVLAPPSVSIGARDKVIVDGQEYTVEGDQADWTTGPFSFSSGVQINLKKVEG